MYKYPITYKDFDGNEITETFWFNLTKAELTKMDYSEAGGITKRMERMVNAKDNVQIMNVFTAILKAAYGEKSDDGRYFNKSEEIYKKFESSAAYSEIFMTLCTDEQKGLEFLQGIMPKDVYDKIKEAEAKEGKKIKAISEAKDENSSK